MPYKSRNELPKRVKDNLPEGAQTIYKEAFNSARDQYDDPDKRRNRGESAEEVAHKVAWGAVKNEYHKNNSGKWVHD